MSAASDRLRSGVLRANELLEALGVSPATLSRRLREDSKAILRVGRGRATRYGLIQPWAGIPTTRFPLVRIDEKGSVAAVGELVTLAARQTAWVPIGRVFDGLPIEIADASPSGFLGQLFARQHADIGVPARTQDWAEHHSLLAVSRRGEDLPGNLIVGSESMDRWYESLPQRVTPENYPELADDTLAGVQLGSSVGGERPKFGAYSDGRHVLVKFAGRAGASDSAAQRWRDLLALEALALDVLREHNIPSARAQLFSADTHKFLEVERFDRIGERGRRAVITLAAVHQDPADSWSQAALRLREAGKISTGDAQRLRLLDAFGALIGNTDRHHHNAAFFPSGTGYTLAPAFDQLPMFYAPGGDGSVSPREFTPPRPAAEMLDVWDEARALALNFWQDASEGPTVSDGMRRIAAAHAHALSAS
ncbi:MAG TPA: HipA domain-containing protein [Vicinamibacterales bacterium]|nr:HipA domain-containing protein [Vicinamibacterales bacterium]